MAIGLDIIKTTGRIIFDLERGEEKTTRTIDVPFPKDADLVQEAVNTANSTFTGTSYGINTFIQPANWRDDNVTENQWTTTRVSYELVTTTTTPITPDTPVTVGSAQEHQQDQQG